MFHTQLKPQVTRVFRFKTKETGKGDQYTTSRSFRDGRCVREDIVVETVPLGLVRGTV